MELPDYIDPDYTQMGKYVWIIINLPVLTQMHMLNFTIMVVGKLSNTLTLYTDRDNILFPWGK